MVITIVVIISFLEIQPDVSGVETLRDALEHMAGGGHQPLLGFSPRMTLMLGLGKVFLLQGQLLQTLGTTASKGTSPPEQSSSPTALQTQKHPTPATL